jgi:hypothetical protein
VDIHMFPGDESWGLVRPYDFSRRPAFYSYKTTIEFLSGFTGSARWEEYETHQVVRFVRPQGVTRVLWARTAAAVTVELPAIEETALLVSATGESRQHLVAESGRYTIQLEGARCRGECLIGGPPVFLVEGEEAEVAVPQPAAGSRRSEPAGTPAQPLAAAATPVATIPPAVVPTPAPSATPAELSVLTAPVTELPETVQVAPQPALAPAAATGGSLANQAGLWLLAAGLSLALALVVWARSGRNR